MCHPSPTPLPPADCLWEHWKEALSRYLGPEATKAGGKVGGGLCRRRNVKSGSVNSSEALFRLVGQEFPRKQQRWLTIPESHPSR